ncbi:glycosyltransferase family 4 protein [Jinshanibacter sp. LJY008]|uniref:Glycosyltransferase family 4 protein n=1 Tax=Limnobaculum eriocheiris TaxID=2897391 RepID=A0A9X1MUE8_9GAMM|nr:glycosyltransferase family 4 protein [Limnobaculum eriocheiris]MCD1124780.1 glycosyltransferase family 4 protein [Limnobaculum eriocheiris]
MKRLMFILNVDTFFISHRLPIAIAAMNNGYEVHLVCQFTDRQEYISDLGIKTHPIKMSRCGMNILSEALSFLSILNAIRNNVPDIIHLVTIKPVIYGGLASKLLRIKKVVAAISGLGYVFLAEGLKAKLLRFFLIRIYKLSINGKRITVIFQNNDDKSLFVKLGIINPKQSVLIRGSGVDLEQYHVVDEPVSAKPTAMFIGRLLKDKGVYEFVEAAKILKFRNVNVRMVLLGDFDDNPKSIKPVEVNNWKSIELVEHWGYTNDVPLAISKSNIVVLPSYREGLPKCLIEAAACARSIITTDVPGCRDAIIPNNTGLLVPVRDAMSLANAIEELLLNPDRRKKMGNEGRLFAEGVFDINIVIQSHLNIYNNGY